MLGPQGSAAPPPLRRRRHCVRAPCGSQCKCHVRCIPRAACTAVAAFHHQEAAQRATTGAEGLSKAPPTPAFRVSLHGGLAA